MGLLAVVLVTVVSGTVLAIPVIRFARRIGLT
jgi:hypothetical protein